MSKYKAIKANTLSDIVCNWQWNDFFVYFFSCTYNYVITMLTDQRQILTHFQCFKWQHFRHIYALSCDACSAYCTSRADDIIHSSYYIHGPWRAKKNFCCFICVSYGPYTLLRNDSFFTFITTRNQMVKFTYLLSTTSLINKTCDWFSHVWYWFTLVRLRHFILVNLLVNSDFDSQLHWLPAAFVGTICCANRETLSTQLLSLKFCN